MCTGGIPRVELAAEGRAPDVGFEVEAGAAAAPQPRGLLQKLDLRSARRGGRRPGAGAGAGGSSVGCPPPVCMRLAEALTLGLEDASTTVIVVAPTVVEPVITAL